MARRLTRDFSEASVFWNCSSSSLFLSVRTCNYTNPLTGITTSSAWNLDGVAGTTAPFDPSYSTAVARSIAVGSFIQFDVTEQVRAALASGEPLAWMISTTKESMQQTVDFAARECGSRCATAAPTLDLYTYQADAGTDSGR